MDVQWHCQGLSGECSWSGPRLWRPHWEQGLPKIDMLRAQLDRIRRCLQMPPQPALSLPYSYLGACRWSLSGCFQPQHMWSLQQPWVMVLYALQQMRERSEINDSLLPDLRYQRHNIFVVWDGMFPVAAVGVFSLLGVIGAPVTKSGLSKEWNIFRGTLGWSSSFTWCEVICLLELGLQCVVLLKWMLD